MRANELLQTIRARQVTVRLAGDQIIFKPGHLVEDLAVELRAHKPEIIALLRSRLAECPLWAAGLICHLHAEGRCNHDPANCNVANGMRRYLQKHYREARR